MDKTIAEDPKIYTLELTGTEVEELVHQLVTTVKNTGDEDLQAIFDTILEQLFNQLPPGTLDYIVN